MCRKSPDLGPRKVFFLIFHMSLCLPLNSIGETLKQARFWRDAQAGHKMLKKPPRPSNSGARMRGPRRRRMPSFEAVRPFVSVRGTSRFSFKRVTVWWTCAPFFDLLTPKQGRTVPRLFRPVEGVPSRQIFKFRLDPTLASRVHETARPNPFK